MKYAQRHQKDFLLALNIVEIDGIGNVQRVKS